MLIYNGSKGQFNNDVKTGIIADKINRLFYEHGIVHENEREYMAWKNSLEYMNKVLDADCFSDDLQIAVEYQIPQTSKRVDFIIAGDDDHEKHNVIIVELKQWSEASKTQRHCIVKAYTGGNIQFVAHPSYQAYSYAKTIENYNEVVEKANINLYPCAYLHNYKKGQKNGIEDSNYYDIIKEAPLFLKEDEKKLQEFIKKYVARPSKTNIMYQIDNGRIRPSKSLQDALSSMLSGNEEFYLIDEQKVVYETVHKLVEKALESNNKFTVIVEGGPGTGKSVVAIQLLVSLIKSGYNAHYVTKNAAPRNVYYQKLIDNNYKKSYISNLFKSSGAYINSQFNELDCIIVDEAHRLVAKSGFKSNLGENQIKEIINAAKVSVFFIDEAQIVTAKDIGRISEIKKWANFYGSAIFHDESTVLHSQFRCNGSDSYIRFLEYILGMNCKSLPCGEMEYDFKLFDNPMEMKKALYEKNKINNKSRMLAGYCYDWITKDERDRNSDKYDIILPNGFRAKWNFNDSSKIWAIDENSFDQVGCIHTSQGLEFDYVGVIIGKDLRYQNGVVITDPSVHPRRDVSFKDSSNHNCSAEMADFIIRNTYKTLMTRGQKGCYVYCEDVNLLNYFESIISKIAHHYK